MGNYGAGHKPFRSQRHRPAMNPVLLERLLVQDVKIDAADHKHRSLRLNATSRIALAGKIRAALAGYRRADVIVYDAAGKPIARIDGESRKRTPL